MYILMWQLFASCLLAHGYLQGHGQGGPVPVTWRLVTFDPMLRPWLAS
jgi:hypothetical protein